VAWTLTAAVIGLTVVGILSIGIFVLPIAVLLGVACGRASKGSARPGVRWRPPANL
jgi:hypothetical protein